MSKSAPQNHAYEMLIDEARAAVREHDLVRGEHLAREALAHEPQRGAAYNVIAVVKDMQGQHSLAMDLLRAGLAVEPTYAPAQENLARIGLHPRREPLLGDEDA